MCACLVLAPNVFLERLQIREILVLSGKVMAHGDRRCEKDKDRERNPAHKNTDKIGVTVLTFRQRPRVREPVREVNPHAFQKCVSLNSQHRERPTLPLDPLLKTMKKKMFSSRETAEQPNARDKTFQSWTLADIDKPGMHLDSPIKMGNEATLRHSTATCTPPPLQPVACLAPSNSPETLLPRMLLAKRATEEARQRSG